MKCPKCGYEIEAQQNRAAKSRWANMTKAERAAEMSRIRKKGQTIKARSTALQRQTERRGVCRQQPIESTMNDQETNTAIVPESQATSRSSDGLESTIAKWIQGEISLGKMLNTVGCSRPSGDDLAGAIRNYYAERIREVMRTLEAKETRAQLDFQESEHCNHREDMAEIGRAHV